jgi:UDP-galactopyranose mutase
MQYDWVIVGAGLVGCTLAEQIASRLDERVLVVESRKHVGGNIYDEVDVHGILVHRYGPHLFHTNNERVWRYLSRFTTWRSYEHRVLAKVGDHLIPVPFNFNSLHALFPPDQACQLENLLLQQFGPLDEIPILRLRDDRERKIRQFADFVYENIFLGYTVKQWGLTPEELSPAVVGRVPVRFSRDNRYFRDRYQGIPTLGYTHMVQQMLSHKKIDVALGATFRSIRGSIGQSRVIYTGPIDVFFDCVHGILPYRSLRFEFSNENVRLYQCAAQINYPNEHTYTRCIEHKHFTGQEAPRTTITREFPEPHVMGENEPLYPIPRPANSELYARYVTEAVKLSGHVLFAGRLADYKYYNMDQAVARALSLFERSIATTSSSTTRPESFLQPPSNAIIC